MTGLKTLREAKHLTQDGLAQLLGVGRTTITMWENGQNVPRTTDLPAISKALDCSVEDLLDALKRVD